MGEFVLYKPLHANITNAITTTLHFVIDALAAFIVAILVQVVRPFLLSSLNVWNQIKHTLETCMPGKTCLLISLVSCI